MTNHEIATKVANFTIKAKIIALTFLSKYHGILDHL